MKNKKQKFESAAILTIKDAAKMTPSGRKEVAKWLVSCSKGLVKDGKLYSSRFTARYVYKK